MTLIVGGVPAQLRLGGTVAAQTGFVQPRLPRFLITTEGGVPVTSREEYVNATGIMKVPGLPDDTRTLRIRGRGNYTWGLPKKPYRLNFDTAYQPWGMTANQKNWALIANHEDPRKLGYMTGLHLGSKMSGLVWTPQFRQVEVTLNGDYIGLYLLMDLVRRETGRVPGSGVSGTTGDALTGTWLAEISRRYVSEGAPGFTTSRDVMIQYEDPEVGIGQADPAGAQATYFRDWIQNFEDVLYGESWLNAETGYARFVDMPSFADWWLMNDFGANQDSEFESSVKLWKERDSVGGKLRMGPLWDFSIAFGNVVNTAHDPTGWCTIPGAKWIYRMLHDPAFKTVVMDRWSELKTHLADTYETQNALMAAQAAAMVRDEDRWGLSHVDPQDALDFVQDWMETRRAWFNANLPGLG